MKYLITIRKKIYVVIAVMGLAGAFALTTVPARAHAAPAMPYAPTAFADACPQLKDLHKGGSNKGNPGMQCFIKTYANPFIKFLAAVAAIFVVISVVIGGIQYTMSADDPGKVTAAKKRIFDAVLALLAFLFLWAFLQWIVPGGVNG